jgi:hypothetical protein
VSSDIRAALERLVEIDDANSINGADPDTTVWDEVIAAARAALAAEPVGEGPSELELEAIELALWDKHRTKGWGGEEFMYDNNFSYALEEYRATLARWGTPAASAAPEPGEVGELVRRLKKKARMEELVGGPLAAGLFIEAATLLQQLSAPAPVAEPVGELSPKEVEAQDAFTQLRDEVLNLSDGVEVNEVLGIIDNYTPEWV